jgi:integrase
MRGPALSKTWTADELRRFLDFERTEDDSLQVAYLLSATTGMRRGEVLGLRWRDCDLDAHQLSVRQTLVSVAYKLHFSTPKTRRGQRLITLDRQSAAALREHCAAQAQERLIAGSAWQDHDLVFCRGDGTPIHPDYFSHRFERQHRSTIWREIKANGGRDNCRAFRAHDGAALRARRCRARW